MAHGNRDAAEVLGGQTTLVGQGAHDGTRAHALALAHVQAVGLKVPIRAARSAVASSPTTVAVAATAITVETVALAAVLLADRALLEQEVLSALQLHGQGCGDVIHRHVFRRGVFAHHLAEEVELLVLLGGADGGEELLLALCIDFIGRRQLHLLEACVSHTLDGAQHPALTRGDEKDRLTTAASATGAADAVHVRLGVIRDVVVDHVGDALDVETAGSHVGGHQDVQAAVLELVHGALALLLRNIAVDGGRIVAGLLEAVRHLFGLVLSAAEDNDGIVVDDLKDAGKRVHLVTVRGQQEALRDVVISAALGLDRDLRRIVEVLLRQTADRVRHGGREECDLLVFRGVLQDALHVFLEAHVEHLVRLIKHEEAQLGDVQRALLQVVDDATRGAHDDLRAAAQAGELDAVGLTAVDGQDLDATQVVGEGLEGVRDLEGQLACGREDECLRVAGIGIDLGQHRQREGRGLTRTGLGQADDVATLHEDRDSLCLDWGWLGEAHLGDGGLNIIRQAEVRKTLGIVSG